EETVTAVNSNLETKLTQLHIYVKKTNLVIEGQNSEAIERHLKTLRTILDTRCNSNLDVASKLQGADVEIGKVRKWIHNHEKEAEINAKKEQLHFKEEIQKMMLQLKADNLILARHVSHRSPNLLSYESWLPPRLAGRSKPYPSLQRKHTEGEIGLPIVTGTNPKAISNFREKLTYCVKALQTLKRLEEVNEATLMTLDKLPGIREDLAIRLWTRRNPIDTKSNERDLERDLGEQRNQKWDRSRKLYQARGQDIHKECLYCGDVSNKASNCQKMTKIEERRATLVQNYCH
ncbi:hypothetical protein P5673_018572, partial [Acropora cervicornis]